MTTHLNYIGIADFRIIKRADAIAHGLSDPGADLIWSKANGFELDIPDDIALFLVGQSDFATDDELNFGQVLAYITDFDARMYDNRTPIDASVTVAKLASDVMALLATTITQATQYGDPLTVGEANMSRLLPEDTVSMSSGSMRLGYFTALKSETISQIRMLVKGAGATAAGTGALAKMCVFQEDPTTFDLTLIAQTASVLNMFTVAGAVQRPLTASFNKVAGARYALGTLIVSTATMPTFAGLTAAGGISSEAVLRPQKVALIGGQTDLLSVYSTAIASSTPSTSMPYVALAP